MSKVVGILYEEKITYQKEIELKTDLEEDDVIEIMEEAEKGADSVEDVVNNLENADGVEVVTYPDNNYDSPMDVELEYLDHREKK